MALASEGESVQHLAGCEADGGDGGGVVAADDIVFAGVAGPPADQARGRSNAGCGCKKGIVAEKRRSMASMRRERWRMQKRSAESVLGMIGSSH